MVSMVKEVLWRKLWWRKVQEGVTFDEEEYRIGDVSALKCFANTATTWFKELVE